MRNILVTGFGLALLWGCGSDPGSILGGAGGTMSSSGGNSQTSSSSNSNTGQGGKSATTTNSVATGGSIAATTATGGASTASSGGTKASTGAGGSSTTTAANSGGKVSTGGTSASTSATASGGKATGGASSVAAGGSATGGAKPTGGASPGGAAAGGRSSGTTATGGTGNTSTSSPGGASASACKNLSFAPSATGKPKPSGTAGGLKVLDWAGFNSAISYTFDDANSSQINNYPAMRAAGGHYTFYLITSKTEASNAVYKTAVQDGHEMGNHTSDHSNCNSASTIDAASTFIKSTFGTTAYAFAAPNGSAACNTASVSGKFLTDRSVAGGTMGAGDTSGLTWLPSDVATTSNMAPVTGKWKTICIHGFTGGSDQAYQPIPLDSFTSAVKAAVSGGAWVETVTNVAAYQVGQKALAGKTGSATWTLPSVFPPNMCVRITTTGGTVKQNGTEVPWDDHGYYEISLDAKSVTIE